MVGISLWWIQRHWKVALDSEHSQSDQLPCSQFITIRLSNITVNTSWLNIVLTVTNTVINPVKCWSIISCEPFITKIAWFRNEWVFIELMIWIADIVCGITFSVTMLSCVDLNLMIPVLLGDNSSIFWFNKREAVSIIDVELLVIIDASNSCCLRW